MEKFQNDTFGAKFSKYLYSLITRGQTNWENALEQTACAVKQDWSVSRLVLWRIEVASQ